MADIPEVTVDNFDSAVLKSKGLVLIYYYAIWCKPCLEMSETVDAIADDISEKIKTVKVNTDKEEAIITQQKIRTIPSFQVMRDGKPEDLIRGPLSKLDLMAKLSAFITTGTVAAPEAEPSKPAA
jgi:thioredoxin 1